MTRGQTDKKTIMEFKASSTGFGTMVVKRRDSSTITRLKGGNQNMVLFRTGTSGTDCRTKTNEIVTYKCKNVKIWVHDGIPFFYINILLLLVFYLG